MPAKKIISILALSVLMSFPAAGIATAGSVRINSNNGSRVKIYRNGGVRIKSSNGRVIRVRPSRSYRRKLQRNRAYRPYRKYPVRHKRWSSRCNSKTYQRTVRNRSGSNSSYSYSRTTSCQ